MSLSKQLIEGYIKNLGLLEDPLALNMTEEEIPSILETNGAEEFIDILYQKIIDKKRIVILGDYDADGSCATTVAERTILLASELLTGEKAKVNYIIPHRFKEGYGISRAVIDRLKRSFPKTDTIITVDNGIVGFDAIDYANSLGYTVLVTDHHLGDTKLPNAKVVVNPNAYQDPTKFKGICGTTVIFKLMLEFAKKYLPNNVSDFEAFVDFVGLATVADVMPVLYENRVWIKKSLSIFNQSSKHPRRFAWTAIIEELENKKRITKNSIFTETDFGFIFGPIINAQSRVTGEADAAVDIFLSRDSSYIREKAKFLVGTNEERKLVTTEGINRANLTDFSDKSIIIHVDEELGDGYIGLISGRLAEQYKRPTIVFTRSHNGDYKGSARGTKGYNLFDVLKQGKHLAKGMGGHSGAAGMSIGEENFEEFVALQEKLWSKIISKEEDSKTVEDFSINANDLTAEFVEEFLSYAPFGEAFPFPKVKIDNLLLTKVRLMGAEKNHIKLETDSNIDLISWGGAEFLSDKISEDTEDCTLSVIGTPSINTFLGKEKLTITFLPNDIVIK